MKMEIKTKTVPVFEDKITAGNIIELQVDSKGNKTEEPEYYLIGYSKEAGYYYLVNIETGTAFDISYESYCKSKEEIQYLIKEYNGQVYDEKDAKLVMEETK